jgi:UTP:GlnB (protein PII) uridylyltransferase
VLYWPLFHDIAKGRGAITGLGAVDARLRQGARTRARGHGLIAWLVENHPVRHHREKQDR